MNSENLKVLFVVNVNNFGHSQSGIFTFRQFLCLQEIKNIRVSKIDLPVHQNKFFSYLSLAFKIRKMSQNYDIIHAHHSYSILLSWVFKKKNTRLVGTFLSDGENNFRFKFRWFNKLLYYLTQMICDHVIIKNDQSVIWSKKSSVIGNPVNTDKFQSKNQLDCKKKIGLTYNRYIGIIISGNIHRLEKNITEYHRIIYNLRNKYYPLVINDVSPDEICDYINCCDFVLVPSKFEGSPNVVKEALACGVPVVSRDVGDVKKLLYGLQSCYVYDDPSEINIELLEKLIDGLNPVTLRKRVIDFYGTEAEVATKIVRIYEGLISI